VLEFLNNLWGWEPSRNRVVVPAHQATQPGRMCSLESILVLLKSLKIRALYVAGIDKASEGYYTYRARGSATATARVETATNTLSKNSREKNYATGTYAV